MTAIDEQKALREQLQGMNETLNSIRRLENEAEEAMGKAERQLNDVRKVRGFLKIHVDAMRERLEQLLREQNAKGG